MIAESRRPGPAVAEPSLSHDKTETSTRSASFKTSVFETGGIPHTLSDIRHALEIKCAACWALGQIVPIDAGRIRNPHLARLIGAAQLFARSSKPWSVRDLLECNGDLEGPALTVAMASKDKPRWTNTDYAIFDALERMEELQKMEGRSAA